MGVGVGVGVDVKTGVLVGVGVVIGTVMGVVVAKYGCGVGEGNQRGVCVGQIWRQWPQSVNQPGEGVRIPHQDGTGPHSLQPMVGVAAGVQIGAGVGVGSGP